MEKILEEILENNDYLGGWVDFREGDIMAPINQEEKFQKIIDVDNIQELYDLLKNYVGAYRYNDLIFMNDDQFGCFVYRLSDLKNYIEHLSIDYMDYEDFAKTVKELVGEKNND